MCAVPSVKALVGLVDPEWHTDQLHRMGAGNNPDVTRSRLLTAVSAIKRNGFDAFRSKRGTATAHKKRSKRSGSMAGCGATPPSPALRNLLRFSDNEVIVMR